MLAQAPAWAHGSVPGLGSFASGVLHPLLAPPHALALVALGLLLGQRGLEHTHPTLPAFMLATVLGLVAAGLGWQPDTDLVLMAGAALGGLALAWAAPLPPALLAAAAALLGCAVGLGSRPDALAGSALAAALAGSGLGAALCVLNACALASALRRPRLALGLRKAGSWIAASALLVAALALAPARLAA